MRGNTSAERLDNIGENVANRKNLCGIIEMLMWHNIAICDIPDYWMVEFYITFTLPCPDNMKMVTELKLKTG